MKSITSSRSRYKLNEDGIIIQEAFIHIQLDLEIAKEEVATFIKLAGGKKRPLLVIAKYDNRMPKEVREYYRSKSFLNYLSAMALYTESKMMKMIGSFFLGIYKPSYPFKIFSDKKDALEWLKKFAN